jgi:pseudouridine-5'-phosphate glycosidase
LSTPATSHVVISETVAAAVAHGEPVLALESTIFTHGLPRPSNVEVALGAEEQARDLGVVPATIGVVDGVATIGLSEEQIKRLAYDDEVIKVSVRDLPVALATGASGGTTVAGTAFLAHRAGVRVFSTGGLGGVHRSAGGQSFDESADLTVLSRTPILMVSAGVKSILDIAASLERMETLSLPVVGYRTRMFPGFYVSDSGYTVEHAVQSPEEAAALVEARDELGLECAVLVANPVDPAQQLDPALHDKVLADAWQAAHDANIVGNDTTPFLLDYITKATDGVSKKVNVEVYRNNVEVGALIAKALVA